MLLSYPWINTDSVFAHLIRESEDEEFYNLPSKFIVQRATSNCLAWVYGDSPQQQPFSVSSVYVCQQVTTTSLYKRFETLHIDRLNTRKKQVDVASGLLRNWVLNYVLCYDPVVELRVVGVRHRIEHLLHRLTHLGKKRVVGYGEVRRMELHRLSSASEVLFDEDGKLTRHVPAWAVQEPNDDWLFWGVPYPPYWDKSKLCLCVMPNTRVTLIEPVREQMEVWDVLTR